VRSTLTILSIPRGWAEVKIGLRAYFTSIVHVIWHLWIVVRTPFSQILM
jgi:hypothetical protein